MDDKDRKEIDDFLATFRKKEIVCPYCFHAHDESWALIDDDAGEEEVSCRNCGKTFACEVVTSVKYTTSKTDEDEENPPTTTGEKENV